MNRNLTNDAVQPKVHLQLLQDVVAAQVRLWDARLALEKATAPEGEYSDHSNDKVIEEIDALAAGLHDADEAYTRVTGEHLQKVLSLSHL
jgi:hypothetical protein